MATGAITKAGIAEVSFVRVTVAAEPIIGCGMPAVSVVRGGVPAGAVVRGGVAAGAIIGGGVTAGAVVGRGVAARAVAGAQKHCQTTTTVPPRHLALNKSLERYHITLSLMTRNSAWWMKASCFNFKLFKILKKNPYTLSTEPGSSPVGAWI